MKDALIRFKSNYINSKLLPLQLTAVFAINILIGLMIANRPKLFLALFLAILLIIVLLKKPVWALAILISMGINFFGAINFTSLPSVPLPGLGSLFINDVVLLSFISIAILRISAKGINPLRSSLSYPIIALLLLTGLQAVRSLLEGSSPQFIANQLRDVSYYSIFFITLIFLKSKKDIIQLIKALIVISVLSAFVTYYQAITGQLNFGSHVVYSSDYGIFRSYNLGLFAMTSTFLILLTSLIGAPKNNKFFLSNHLNITILLLIGGAILIMLMRNIWISLLFSIALIIFLNIKKINKFIIVLFLGASLFTIWWIPAIEYFIDSQPILPIIYKRGFEAYSDAASGGGTFGLRTELLQHRWNYMLKTNLFWGQGFKETSGYYYWDPTYATGENTGAFIATRYGISGFFIFSWLLFAILKKIINLYRKLEDSWQKTLICGLLAFNIHIIITSYFAAPFVTTFGIVILTPFWAIVELIERFNDHEYDERIYGHSSSR